MAKKLKLEKKKTRLAKAQPLDPKIVEAKKVKFFWLNISGLAILCLLLCGENYYYFSNKASRHVLLQEKADHNKELLLKQGKTQALGDGIKEGQKLLNTAKRTKDDSRKMRFLNLALVKFQEMEHVLKGGDHKKMQISVRNKIKNIKKLKKSTLERLESSSEEAITSEGNIQ
ncbi:MAG: hypothetical protein HQL32_16140 [Planctomycetes bacterium]|nr:hypothetical protein [Planctomycetota bacterium]